MPNGFDEDNGLKTLGEWKRNKTKQNNNEVFFCFGNLALLMQSTYFCLKVVPLRLFSFVRGNIFVWTKNLFKDNPIPVHLAAVWCKEWFGSSILLKWYHFASSGKRLIHQYQWCMFNFYYLIPNNPLPIFYTDDYRMLFFLIGFFFRLAWWCVAVYLVSLVIISVDGAKC